MTVGLALIGFAVVYFSPIDYTFADPWGNLPTAQAILEHGTIKLDDYADSHAIAELRLASRHRDHLYYRYPLGTPILVLPAVLTANLLGMDMADSADNTALQRLLSALIVGLSIPLIVAVGRQYLPYGPALLLTLALVFGSSVASSIGTGLWSHDLTFLLNLTIVLLLVRHRRGVATLNPQLLGLLLFLSFLCRPTAAILVLVTLAYLALLKRELLFRALVTLTALGAALVAFSYVEYGLPLPPYYLPSRLGTGTLWVGLFGNLLGPSRGLLVFCPYLVLVGVGAVRWRRQIRTDPLFLFALSWLTLHWITVSSNNDWWGGWSFGTRFFADAIPAAALLTAIVASFWLQEVPRLRHGLAGIFATLTLAAILIHSYQGLYSVNPFLWSQDGTYVDHLFDWRYPQFLATEASLAEHRRQHLLPALEIHPLSKTLEPDSPDVVWEGWSRPENGGTWRWSQGPSSTLMFRIDRREARAQEPLVLQIDAGTHQAQRIIVVLNGTPIGSIDSRIHWEPASYRFEIERSLLATEEVGRPPSPVLELRFLTPEALSPASLAPDGEGDERVLGLCLRKNHLRLAVGAADGALGPSRAETMT